jgi:hypothetical protein
VEAAAFVVAALLGAATLATSTSVAWGLMVASPSVERPWELFVVRGGHRQFPSRTGLISAADYRNWVKAIPTVPVGLATPVWSGGYASGYSEPIRIAAAESRFLDLLGATSLEGFALGSPAPAIPALASRSLIRSFGEVELGDVLQVGKPDGLFRIVGVLPEGFRFPLPGDQPDLVVPLVLRASDFGDREDRRYFMLLRTAPTGADALARSLSAIADASKDEFPADSSLTLKGFDRVVLQPLEELRDPVTVTAARSILVVGGMLCGLLVLGLAGLTSARWRSVLPDWETMRMLGSPPWRLAAQPVAELSVLCATVLVGGGVLSAFLLRAFESVVPADVYFVLDRLAYRAAISLCVLTAVVFVTCAISTLRPLWATGRFGRRGRSMSLRGYLTVFQAGVAFVLIAGSVSVAGTVWALWQSVGYAQKGLLAAELRSGRADRGSSIQEALDAVQQMPGVAAAAAVDSQILRETYRADISWQSPAGAERFCLAGPKLGVTAGFFEAVGLQLSAGRLPTAAEAKQGVPIAVMSEAAARSCWPVENPLGRTINVDGKQYSIVGLVRDARFISFAEGGGTDEVYLPLRTMKPWPVGTVFMRSNLAPAVIERQLRASLDEAGIAPEVTRVFSLEAELKRSGAPLRLAAWVLTGLALCSILVMGCSLYGAVSMRIAQRRRELGLRLALGATPGEVSRKIVEESLRMAVAGVGIGGVLLWWYSRIWLDAIPEQAVAPATASIAAVFVVLLTVVLACGTSLRNVYRLQPSELFRKQ